MKNVFVYGTLLFPEILNGLTGSRFQSVEAVLPGYKRHLVKNGSYPAVVATKNEKVYGKLINDVDQRSLDILRYYEGEDYKCTEAEVIVTEKSLNALVFVWNAELHYLAESDWKIEAFKHDFLQEYIQEVVPETVEAFNRLFL